MHTTRSSRLFTAVGCAALACALGAAAGAPGASAPAVELVAHTGPVSGSGVHNARQDDTDGAGAGGPSKPEQEQSPGGGSKSAGEPDESGASKAVQEPAEEQPVAGAPKTPETEGQAGSSAPAGAEEAQGIVERVWSGISSFLSGLFGG